MEPSDKQLITDLRLFLTEIGIETREKPLPDTTFLPGLLIEDGILWLDLERLAYPGDILHEAGHIAVSLPNDRKQLSGNITEHRPDKAGDEIAVLLWTYAACTYLKLPPQVVFHPAGYKGESDWLIEQFSGGNYIGLPLLAWMGLALPLTSENPTGGFPTLSKWLRN